MATKKGNAQPHQATPVSEPVGTKSPRDEQPRPQTHGEPSLDAIEEHVQAHNAWKQAQVAVDVAQNDLQTAKAKHDAAVAEATRLQEVRDAALHALVIEATQR